MGYYHYAQNLLKALSDVDDLTVDAFYINAEGDAEFTGTNRAQPLATSTSDSFMINTVLSLLYHVQFLIYLLASRPDVIHFNTVFRNQYHTYSLTLLGKLTGTRVIRTVHEVVDERLDGVSAKEKQIAHRHLRTCDHCIVHSTAVRADLQSSGISTPTTVLPHGNYLFFREYLKPDTEPGLHIDDEPVVLFFAPRQHKGIDIFVDAVKRTNTTFTTWIAGPIADNVTKEIIRLNSNPQTYVKRGYIPDERLPSYFEYADIVVLPYHSGTTSGAVHLARAFKTAVVTSPLPCFTDAVDHRVDGYVLSQNTPITLSEAIDELVSVPEMRRDLAKAGFRTEQSYRFDWNRIGERTVDIYRLDASTFQR